MNYENIIQGGNVKARGDGVKIIHLQFMDPSHKDSRYAKTNISALNSEHNMWVQTFKSN